MIFDDVWWLWGLSLPKCAVPSIHSKHSALRRNASLAQTTWRWAYKEVAAHCPHNLSEYVTFLARASLWHTPKKVDLPATFFVLYRTTPHFLDTPFWSRIELPAKIFIINTHVLSEMRKNSMASIQPHAINYLSKHRAEKESHVCALLWLHLRRMHCGRNQLMTRTEDTSPRWNSSLSASLVAGLHLDWNPKSEVWSKISAPSNFQLQPMQWITMPINPPAATARCRESSTLLSSWLSKQGAEKQSHVQHCALAASPENALRTQSADDSHWRHITNVEFITFCLTGCWSPSWLESKIGSVIENFFPQQFSASANAVNHHAYQPTSCYSTVPRIQHPAQQLAVEARSGKTKSCPALCFGCISGECIADAISWWLALKTHHQRGIHHFLPHWLLVSILIGIQTKSEVWSKISAPSNFQLQPMQWITMPINPPAATARCRESSTLLSSWLSKQGAEKQSHVQHCTLAASPENALRTQSADDSHWRHITNVEFITFCLTGCWSPSWLESKIGSVIENFCPQQFSASANAVNHHAYQPTSCYSTVPRIQHPAQQLAVEARSKKKKVSLSSTVLWLHFRRMHCGRNQLMTRTEDTSPTWNSSLSASLVAGLHLDWNPKSEVWSKISAPSNFQLQPMQWITMPINPPAATARCREFSTLLSSWLSKHGAKKRKSHCPALCFGCISGECIADAISWWLALKTHHQRGIHHFLPHWLLVSILIGIQNRKCDRKFLPPAIFSFSQCSESPCLSTHQLLQHGAENSAPCSAAGCRSTEQKKESLIVQHCALAASPENALRTQSADDSHWRHITNVEFITFCLTGCCSPSSLKSKIGSAIEKFCPQQFSASANAVNHHAYQPTSCYSTVPRIQHPAQQLAVEARSKKKKVSLSSTVLWLHFRRMDCRSMAETFSEHIWVWLRIGHHKNVKKVMVQNIISSMVLIVISTLRTQSADDSHWRHITNVEFITFCLTGCCSPSSLKSKIGSAIEKICPQQFSASANAVHHHACNPPAATARCREFSTLLSSWLSKHGAKKRKSHCPALCFGCISGEWTAGPWLKLFLNTSGFDSE